MHVARQIQLGGSKEIESASEGKQRISNHSFGDFCYEALTVKECGKKKYWKASIISWNIWKKLIHWSGIFCPVHSKNYGCLGKQNVIILLYEITPHRKVLSGMELDPMTQKEKCYVAKSYVDCITTIMWKQRKSASPQNWN